MPLTLSKEGEMTVSSAHTMTQQCCHIWAAVHRDLLRSVYWMKGAAEVPTSSSLPAGPESLAFNKGFTSPRDVAKVGSTVRGILPYIQDHRSTVGLSKTAMVSADSSYLPCQPGENGQRKLNSSDN